MGWVDWYIAVGRNLYLRELGFAEVCVCVCVCVCRGWGRVVRSLEAKLMLIEENTRSSDLVPVTVGCQRVLFTLR